VTINIHESHLQSKLDKGYRIVEQFRNGRVEVAHPDDTCLREMRGNTFCLMDKDHRGRCSSVVFYCEACNKTRRGRYYQAAFDGNGEVDVVFCWFCVHVVNGQDRYA
jgi:hypothetical protein